MNKEVTENTGVKQNSSKLEHGKTYKTWLKGGVWITCYYLNGLFYPTQIPAFCNSPVEVDRWEPYV